MTDYSKITALYSRLSVGDEDRDGGESNSIQNQKIFLENYARGQHLTNIRHYIDDDESGRFFDRSAYSRMMDDVENGKIGVCIMKDLTRWGRDYLQVSLGISTNLEAVTAQYVDVRLERKQSVLQTYHKALQPKTTVTGKEAGQETSKKAKKKNSEMEL